MCVNEQHNRAYLSIDDKCFKMRRKKDNNTEYINDCVTKKRQREFPSKISSQWDFVIVRMISNSIFYFLFGNASLVLRFIKIVLKRRDRVSYILIRFSFWTIYLQINNNSPRSNYFLSLSLALCFPFYLIYFFFIGKKNERSRETKYMRFTISKTLAKKNR